MEQTLMTFMIAITISLRFENIYITMSISFSVFM